MALPPRNGKILARASLRLLFFSAGPLSI